MPPLGHHNNHYGHKGHYNHLSNQNHYNHNHKNFNNQNGNNNQHNNQFLGLKQHWQGKKRAPVRNHTKQSFNQNHPANNLQKGNLLDKELGRRERRTSNGKAQNRINVQSFNTLGSTSENQRSRSSDQIEEEKLALLRKMVSLNYYPSIRYLDLEAVVDKLDKLQQQQPSQYELSFSNQDGAFWKQILEISQQLCPDVVTLTVANNNINSLALLSQLAGLFPHLVNLNLASNQLHNMDELLHLKDVKMREIVLRDNPLLSSLLQNDLMADGKSVLKYFPGLVVLDMQSLEFQDTEPREAHPEPKKPVTKRRETQSSDSLSQKTKEELITKLKGITKMKYPFSLDCLEKNQWNLDMALLDFNQLKANKVLPAEIFEF